MNSWRRRVGWGVMIAGLLLAGCESVGNRGVPLIDEVAPQGNYFARSQEVVFPALVEVLETMGYTITREAAAQGFIEARGHLLESDEPGEARQFLISARVRGIDDDETSVELLVRESQEGDFAAGAVTNALKEHGRYDSIYEALEEALGEGSWLPPSAVTR